MVGGCKEKESALQQALEGHSGRALKILTKDHRDWDARLSRSRPPGSPSLTRYVGVGPGIRANRNDLRAAAVKYDYSLEILKAIY